MNSTCRGTGMAVPSASVTTILMRSTLNAWPAIGQGRTTNSAAKNIARSIVIILRPAAVDVNA